MFILLNLYWMMIPLEIGRYILFVMHKIKTTLFNVIYIFYIIFIYLFFIIKTFFLKQILA